MSLAVLAEVTGKAAEPERAPRCIGCGIPLSEINTVEILMKTSSSKGVKSEAQGVFKVCDNCFENARDQMEEMQRESDGSVAAT